MPNSSKLIAEGKVGCIVLAGGDGTRLGYEGPKGNFRLPHINKTLFELLLDKVSPTLPLAVMTSPANHKATKEALPSWITCFIQHTLPLLDLNKNPLPIQKPNGNGEVFAAFAESGLLEKWKAKGVEWVQVIPIDNPLAKPFDPDQIGIHIESNADVTLKGVKRRHPSENIGVIGVKEGKVAIIEYSEKPPQDWDLGNAGLYSFSLSFIEQVARAQSPSFKEGVLQKVKNISLPLHLVKRNYEGQDVWKQETFIFDLLPYSQHTEVISCAREENFAPLKSLDDLAEVEKAVQFLYK